MDNVSQTATAQCKQSVRFSYAAACESLSCLQGVAYTKRDAQEAMQKLVQGNVVLVGHALHHDLHALQLDPTAVIDTALLCSYK